MTDTSRGNSATRARWQTCLRLARELLVVGPDGKDLKLEYPHTLIDTGCLGPIRHPRRKMTGFHLDVSRPEGPAHFAGEHTSLKHAWIEGALESAVRAAFAVHQVPPVTDREGPGPDQDASGADRQGESS
ncbi:hypothetical protein BIV24_26470 [Streptomyces colonosanans]|uniref:Amine oxidase domain-containing protein n=1 Tax=Streptomyces colonosanans TaxID=1428652 RepID=A0A1S2NYC6_9ACTN|nr:hypothetical protein BIV24_26470 [Streptomyces colonosanans]